MKLSHRKVGEGPSVLIILHGLFGSSDNWLTISKSFGEDYTVYLLDQRNHGQSPHDDTFNYKAMSEDLLEFMEDKQINSAIIIGHSMGGKTAMRFAIDYPEKVEKLVVVDIGPRYYPPHHQEILNAILPLDLSTFKSRGEIEATLQTKITDTATRQFLLKNIYWIEEGKLAWRMNLPLLSKEIDNVGEAINENSTYSNPTLFIKGARSNYIVPKEYGAIHRLFSPSIIDIIPEAGHWVQAEAPEAFCESIKGFLKKSEAVI